MMDISILSTQDELRKITSILKIGASRADKQVLSQCSMTMFRGVMFWVGFHEDTPVTINATHFGKKRTNIWEPYANWYIAYTTPSARRLGFAKELALHVRSLAVEAGCVRMKALAGTRLGYELHRSLGDQFWAVTDAGELAVDTPIINPGVFPTDKTPMGVRKWTDAIIPLSNDEIDEILKEPLRYDRS